ncbi:MAG: bacillithiol biosynthesis cysteine-adding enzyme BshC [Acidobacteria bacterium]|nr:bacillithiol biosynthesis cysteine-adding enzyme BshC [Acidobacteriota bacterium]
MIARIDWRRFEETSLIFAHYLYQFEKVEGFFSHNYQDKNSFYKLAEELRRDKGRDAFLLLAEGNREVGSSKEVVEKLEKAGKVGGVAVITGQQVGLFGGPAYTLFKALTAAKLAHFLEEELKIPVIPIFFLASEDHDIAEVNRFIFLNRDYRLIELSLPRIEEGRRPVSSIRLGKEVEKLLATFKAELPAPGIPPSLEEALYSSYTEEATFSSSFARLLAKLLSPYGIAILEPNSKKLKEIAIPLFEQEILKAKEREELFSSHLKGLSERGYHIQVPGNRGRLNLFLLSEAGERVRIYLAEDGFIIGKEGEKVSSSHLISLLKEEPERFSPDVLLRPLFQDFILPTIAYVAGPAEIAYFAELRPLYTFFNIPMPVIYPRASFTVVDDITLRLAHQLSLAIPELVSSPNETLDRFKRSLVDTEAEEEISQLEEETLATKERIKEKLTELDPNIGKKVDSALGKIIYQLERLKLKIGKANLRRKEELRRRLERLKNILAPDKKPQERMLGWVYLLADYGEKVMDKVYQEIELPPRDHKVIRVER